jgi:hypothetical protein
MEANKEEMKADRKTDKKISWRKWRPTKKK